jgi:anti-sigma B factor antagonist
MPFPACIHSLATIECESRLQITGLGSPFGENHRTVSSENVKGKGKCTFGSRIGKQGWDSAHTRMGFQISTRELDRIIVVDAVGRLTLSDSRTRLRDLIHVFTGNGHKTFLLNLAGVDFVDSDGMGELVRCYSIVRQTGGEMKLAHVTRKVQDLLQITRLNTLFEIYSDEQAALQAFRKCV